MKNILYVAIAMLVLASCEKPNKIGFVDNGVVINDYQEKIDLEAKYKAKDEAFRKRADSIGLAFQTEAQKTQTEAQKILSQAQEAIQNEKRAAINELREQVGSIAMDIAEKVLKKELESKDKQVQLINQLLQDSDLK